MNAAIRLFLSVSCALLAQTSAADPRYTNSWAVEIRGGAKAADQLAQSHGFLNLGQVSCRFAHSNITLCIIIVLNAGQMVATERGACHRFTLNFLTSS